jgi:hypothetical protein
MEIKKELLLCEGVDGLFSGWTQQTGQVLAQAQEQVQVLYGRRLRSRVSRVVSCHRRDRVKTRVLSPG